MKKGRRQISDRNVFDEADTTQQQTADPFASLAQPPNPRSDPTTYASAIINDPERPTSNDIQATKSPASTILNDSRSLQKVREENTNVQGRDEISISPISETKKENQSLKPTQVRPANEDERANSSATVNSADEKKMRIEMLKQKYLKKGAETKVESKIEAQPIVVEKPVIAVSVAVQKQVKNEEVISKPSVQVKTIKQKPVPVAEPVKVEPVVEKPVETKKEEPVRKETPKVEPLNMPAVLEFKQKIEEQPKYVEPKVELKEAVPLPPPVKKTDDKKPGSKAPPPPPKTYQKPKAPPVPEPKKQESDLQPSQAELVASQISPQSKFSPFPEAITPEPQEKEVTMSNPVGSFEMEVKEQEKVRVKNVAPPPPPAKKGSNRSTQVQQILAKRLKKVQPTTPKQPQQIDLAEESQQTAAVVTNTPKVVSAPFDQEYIEKKPEHKPTPKSQQPTFYQPQGEFNNRQLIQLWLNNPAQLLEKFIPHSSIFAASLQEKRQLTPLQFISKNPTFTPIISKLISEFVFKGKGELIDSQKEVVYQLALEYFFSNANDLTTQFLLLLVKLGHPYLQRHAQFFRESSEVYAAKIVQYRDYFVGGELANFVNFIADLHQPREEQLPMLLFASVTEKLLTLATTRSFSPSSSILLLSVCHFINRSNKNIQGLYFKLINSVLELIPDEFTLIEAILKYVNEMETVEKYYQMGKQLKLKLINTISNKERTPVRQTDNAAKNEGKDGLMGYWSKAVDKIKNATSQLTEIQKEKERPKQQAPPEEKEDEIEYDPILKRYRINGKIPQDDSQPSTDPNKTTALPPKLNKPLAPPPPPGNRKPRTAVTRYA